MNVLSYYIEFRLYHITSFTLLDLMEPVDAE